MDIRIKRGTVGIIKLTGQISPDLEIHSNADNMKVRPLIASITDNPLLSLLEQTPQDIICKVDCTECEQDFIIFYVTVSDTDNTIVKATLERNIASISSQKPIKAVDLEMVRDAIKLTQEYLPVEASANAGFEVVYYPAVVIQRYNTISANILKSITDAVAIEVLYPKGGMYENIDFDQFGLKYEQLTKIHIVKKSWLDFGMTGDPQAGDILYMPIADQFFSVSSVDPIKSVANRVYTYELTLSVLTDSASTAIQSDLLDLSGMIEATDLMQDNTDDFDTIQEAAEPTDYGLQRLLTYETVEVEAVVGYQYGICYLNNAWLKYKRNRDTMTLRTLQGAIVPSDPNVMIYNFAKYAVFNNELSSIDENMYYTSITLPTKLKPLQLIEHVTRKPR